MDAFEGQRGSRVEARYSPGRGDDEANLAARRGRLAGPEVVALQLAESPEHVRTDGVEARHQLCQLGVFAAAEACADLDHPRPPVLEPDLHVRRAALDPDRAARAVGQCEQALLCLGWEGRRVAVRNAHAEGRRGV